MLNEKMHMAYYEKIYIYVYIHIYLYILVIP